VCGARSTTTARIEGDLLRGVQMSARYREERACPRERVPSPDRLARSPALEGDFAVVEFPLLLTVHQARALEAAAHRGGLTVGQMARHILRDFLERESRPLCQVVPRRG
jgi:hypothetical protein